MCPKWEHILMKCLLFEIVPADAAELKSFMYTLDFLEFFCFASILEGH